MAKMEKYEKFLKEVQFKYSDEFADLQDITVRYTLLADNLKMLSDRH